MAGLPRSGTTLLTSILSQNPQIHCCNNSLLVQLMYDLDRSFNTKYCRLGMEESGTTDTQHYIMSNLPNLLYHNIENDIIVDHARKWIHPENFELIKKYITQKPKFIVMYRKLEEIISSFVKISPNNETKDYYLNSIYNDEEPVLMESFHSIVRGIREIKDLECIFINYNDILKDTNKVLDLIYNFYQLERFNHDLNNIKDKYYTKDADLKVHKSPGLHDIRPTINKREYSVELSSDIIERCKFLNSVLDEAIKTYKYK
jgi:sulfotransferase